MNKIIPIDLLLSKGAHGRDHEAGLLLLGWCSVCGERVKPGMYTDGSDGEYGGPSFCIDCLRRIVAALEKEEFPKPVKYRCNICLETYDSPPEGGDFHICSRTCWNTLAKWNETGVDWRNSHPLKGKNQ